MSYEFFKNIVTNRRSIRRFKDEPVPKEIIEEIIDCARWAPSDTNQQPWKFISISNKNIIQKIEEATKKGMEKLKKRAEKLGKEDVIKKIEVFSRYALVFKNAPHMLICLAEPYKSKFTEEIFDPIGYSKGIWRDEGIKSTSLAVQNILLAAHALGYGACPMSAPIILAEEEIRKVLNVEDKYIIALIIALGKPEGSTSAPPRKELSEILEYIE